MSIRPSSLSASGPRSAAWQRHSASGGSWWQADPTDGSVLIFLAHNMVELRQMARGIGLGVWSPIAAFHAVANA